MRIKLINPNTTMKMTASMGDCARQFASVGTDIVAVSPKMGPASIESYYDEALSVPGILEEIRVGEKGSIDGYVIACFGDPGLYAARELARGPVVGIAEAAMHAASMLGTGFSVVTTLQRTCGMAWHLAENYGMKRFCKNVRAVEIPVLALEHQSEQVLALIVAECKLALKEDASDVIVLGCAGMANLAREVSDAVGVPVVEGVAAAIKTVESLVSLRLRTSKKGDFATPLPKEYIGLMSDFAI